MMKKTYLFLLLLILGGLTFSLTAADDEEEYHFTEAEIEKALLSLREGAKDSEVEAAKFVLENAGKNAFPLLIKHLTNKTLVSLKHFKSMEWVIDPKTQMAMARKTLTIGDVAFRFIQGAIEDDFPIEFRFFQVLTRENVAQWVQKYRFLSIYEMRQVAARESLAKAEAQYKIDRSDHTQTAITYLKNLVTRYSMGS